MRRIATLGAAPAEQAAMLLEQRAARPGYRPPMASFGGRRVLTLESRRAPELALLVLNYGGIPVVAPSLQEVPLEANRGALGFAEGVINRQYDLLVLSTGVGTRLLMQLAEPVFGRQPFIDALAASRILARGPKPVAALREIGVSPWLTAPAPNTWREMIETLDAKAPGICAGARVAVQEYGTASPELVEALEWRGAAVTAVPIYRWALPEDVRPLRSAIAAILRGEIDVVILTAGIQLVHLLQVAGQMDLESAVRRGLERMIVASIGPMTSEELRRQHIPIDIEPTHPKMGFLVKEAAEQCGDLLHAKQHVQS